MTGKALEDDIDVRLNHYSGNNWCHFSETAHLDTDIALLCNQCEGYKDLLLEHLHYEGIHISFKQLEQMKWTNINFRV